MIYKTPRFTYDACVNRDSITIIEGAGELLSFLRSLPDSFEIVEPGNVQVRWPEGATKEKITWHADNQRGRGLIADSLYALAAIAPVEKKKRKVELWKNQHGSYTLCNPGFKPVEGLSAWERVRTSCPLEVEE